MIDVSLGIPLYNSAVFLDALFACLRGLDPAPREILLLDDGSSDESLASAMAFAASGAAPAPVRVLRHEKNRGIAAALNGLVAEAQGEWLQLLDADDLLVQPDFYARLAPLLDGRDRLLVTALRSNARTLDRAATVVGWLTPSRPPPWWPLLGSVATRSGVVYRRADLIDLAFPDPAFPGSDVLHLLDLRLRGNGRFTRRAHTFYRIHAAAASSQSRDPQRFLLHLRNYGAAVRWCYGLDLRLRRLGQRLLR